MRATAQTSTRSPLLGETVAKITRIVAYQEAIICILNDVLPKSHTSVRLAAWNGALARIRK